MTPTRVLWLTKGLGRGGTERLLAGGLPHIDRSRFQVEVAYILPWKDALVGEIQAGKVVVHCLGRGRGLGLGWALRLRRLVRDGDFDVVHTHMPYPAVAARLVLRRPAPIIVHTEHNLWERYRWPTSWMNAVTYHRNRLVLAVSQGVADSIRPPRWPMRPRPRIEVAVQGIDPASARIGPAARAEGRRRLGIDPDALVVGTVGNLSAKKDHKNLMNATVSVLETYPDLRVVLVGSGPLEEELRQHVDRLGLSTAVVFAGSRDDVADLLPAFDVFALSSRHEGLPIALLEAMASSLPCVATDVGGIPEALRNGVDGLLVPPGDPAALAAALIRVLSDRQGRKAMGASARERAGSFDLSPVVARLQDSYDQVLARP